MRPEPISLFLSGDVMTGRGIDQVLPHPGNPRLFEPYVKDARDYVVIAEQENGLIPKTFLDTSKSFLFTNLKIFEGLTHHFLFFILLMISCKVNDHFPR